MHYTLLFPHGESKWNWGMRLNIPDENSRVRKRLEQWQYYRYHIHERENQRNKILFRAERLFQQYLIDGYAVMDQNKLDWLRWNQNKFRRQRWGSWADPGGNHITGEPVDLGTKPAGTTSKNATDFQRPILKRPQNSQPGDIQKIRHGQKCTARELETCDAWFSRNRNARNDNPKA